VGSSQLQCMLEDGAARENQIADLNTQQACPAPNVCLWLELRQEVSHNQIPFEYLDDLSSGL
jgi:hypothetical protein